MQVSVCDRCWQPLVPGKRVHKITVTEDGKSVSVEVCSECQDIIYRSLKKRPRDNSKSKGKVKSEVKEIADSIIPLSKEEVKSLRRKEEAEEIRKVLPENMTIDLRKGTPSKQPRDAKGHFAKKVKKQ